MKYILLIILFFSTPAMAEGITVYNSKESPADIEKYWTPERMKNAQPMPMGHRGQSENKPVATPKDDNAALMTIVSTLGENKALELGFLIKDKYNTPIITPAGMGYLEYINNPSAQTLHGAYATGFKAGSSQ